LAPSARGFGYGAEAVSSLLARDDLFGLLTVVAETTSENVASQRTLLRAGFHVVNVTGATHWYEKRVRSG
jgi:RimJ/RimL family protein N-acetyltransferase